MPILSNLSRRFHMLTTDAIPEPPRVEIKGYTHNLNPDTINEKSNVNPEADKLLTNGSVPTNTPPHTEEENEMKFPNCDSKPRSKPDVKTKAKSKQYKHSQGARVVNYNIVNSNGVKIGARTSYICNVNQFPSQHTGPSENTWAKPKTQQMPANVKNLCACTDEIALEDIFIIKTHIGHGWKDVARRLSYSDGQIEQFEENYRYKGISEVVYQIFLDWKQANTKDASIGNLMNLLWVCQEYDCATRLASLHEDTI